MSGELHLYFHIPFCVKRCGYCDFYSTEAGPSAGGAMDAYFEKLSAELFARAGKLCESHVAATVYFGGGTPALAGASRLSAILEDIRSAFGLAPDAEVSFEANPAALAQDDLASLRGAGFNRISIGVQSFSDGVLRRLGRAHDAAAAAGTVEAASKAGFDNLSIDLMTGIPAGPNGVFGTADCGSIPREKVRHVSVYQFSVNDRTPVAAAVARNELRIMPDDMTAGEYLRVCSELEALGYAQYEISNFASAPRFMSRHNLAYWRGEDYMGFGAGAVSTLGGTRRTNHPVLEAYLAGDAERDGLYSLEELGSGESALERVMLSLRTSDGIGPKTIGVTAYEVLSGRLRPYVDKLFSEGMAVDTGDGWRLTPRGYLVMNSIASTVYSSLEKAGAHGFVR